MTTGFAGPVVSFDSTEEFSLEQPASLRERNLSRVPRSRIDLRQMEVDTRGTWTSYALFNIDEIHTCKSNDKDQSTLFILTKYMIS